MATHGDDIERIPAVEATAGDDAGPFRRPVEWLALHRWELLFYVVLISLALGMRLWDLGSRAMHHDESLHAFYSWNLSAGFGYEHNPMMHGPFQIEASAIVFRLLGDGEYTARLLYAIAGTALVLLPIGLRPWMGRLGAIIAATLLAFSPAMLYFSRFARNDIIMAFWTLGLVVAMWRYLEEGKQRYLYAAAVLLALAFATKETAYLVTITLGGYLGLALLLQSWPKVRPNIVLGQVSPPVALWRLGTSIVTAAYRLPQATRGSRGLDFLTLLVTLTLPMGAAAVSLFQDTALLRWTNLVLASPVDGGGPIGAPVAGGTTVAVYAVFLLGLLSMYIGYRWNWKVYWRSALVFYAIIVVLYTTFFTNMSGLGSGVWQSLGYWVVQQGEARGGQPWYYYIVIGSVYEFVALLFGLAGIVYYSRRRDRFGLFLAFWAVATFLLYTVASEKMPWLLVNVALPLIVLTARLMADVATSVRWRRLAANGGLLAAPGVVMLVVFLYGLAFIDVETVVGGLVAAALVLALAALAAAAYLAARRIGARNLISVSAVALFGLAMVVSVRASLIVSYSNADVPVEMLVYTQTSPDLARLAGLVEDKGVEAGDPSAVPITVDGTGGFHWPWRWYLRNHEQAGYISLEGSPPSAPPNASVLLVHSSNRASADEVLLERFGEGKRIKHRWWFPETYRGLTTGKFLSGLVDRDTWRSARDYFLFREVRAPLGSEDAFVYFTQEFNGEFEPAN